MSLRDPNPVSATRPKRVALGAETARAVIDALGG
jgi:hypothetical protein